ncbi:DNA-binding protein [Streptacidiphilus pinicola]|uniref:DNA-binding protein n=1 Tax=Streptacidiphilus pinicola TaxID=2219663 RepID=A0A2X0J061_9ACTN|nr:DNA-binding protein [Streptacidiphilus pinicola]RAG80668.1 DNA-binding protein [Streptacidiphilus pinicola]
MTTDDSTTHDLPTGLAEPARHALAEAGYHRLGDLDGVPEAALRRLPGVGPRALRLLKLALAAQGLALGE